MILRGAEPRQNISDTIYTDINFAAKFYELGMMINHDFFTKSRHSVWSMGLGLSLRDVMSKSENRYYWARARRPFYFQELDREFLSEENQGNDVLILRARVAYQIHGVTLGLNYAISQDGGISNNENESLQAISVDLRYTF